MAATSTQTDDLIPVWLLGSSFGLRGSSLYTLRLARHLHEYGFHPTIICESAASLPSRAHDELDIHEIPHLTRPYLRSLSTWAMFRHLKDDLKKKPPALIHAQRRHIDDVAVELADRLDCPYVVTVDDIIPVQESLRIQPDRLRAIIAVSPTIERDLVLGAGVPQELVKMIPTGVELPPMPRLPTARSENRIPIVGTACALEPVKGVTYFLMAAELILSAGHDVEFLVAGSGPDEEILRRSARHLDIANRVTFIDHVPDHVALLETVDVFVVPSLEQGLGTVMIEAMALGKPVVATRVGGIKDFFVDNVHALLVPRANHIALAEKIRYLLDNPTRSRQLAIAGQEFVRQHFSADEMTRQTASLYRAVLGEPSLQTTASR
ncbi:Alpha-D-kanosaminyltransferase [Planctomycetes bacterium Pan216]|uniref:Alpha-D-kanosaminyltransferase n=2 Tax=Kolteria novifilia TaxID=2527975 RepID=A0A518B5Q0_9BACT|nr:Alpha-D-kanosaminyltransferase [Planctomycetes bacterium Pan216]